MFKKSWIRNKVVFAKKMQDTGYTRDWQQCKTKIKNLKKEYRQVKDHNGQTGQGRKPCKHFKELDNILGHRPASVPAVLLDTGTTTNSSTAAADSEDSKKNKW